MIRLWNIYKLVYTYNFTTKWLDCSKSTPAISQYLSFDPECASYLVLKASSRYDGVVLRFVKVEIALTGDIIVVEVLAQLPNDTVPRTTLQILDLCGKHWAGRWHTVCRPSCSRRPKWTLISPYGLVFHELVWIGKTGSKRWRSQHGTHPWLSTDNLISGSVEGFPKRSLSRGKDPLLLVYTCYELWVTIGHTNFACYKGCQRERGKLLYARKEPNLLCHSHDITIDYATILSIVLVTVIIFDRMSL